MDLSPQAARRRLRVGILGGIVFLLVVGWMGVSLGPAPIPIGSVLTEIVDRLPIIALDSNLSDREAAIVWELRVPRVVLGALVGAMLAVAGGSYQGVFRNPLADPFLLGVAAGAGLGATVAIVAGSSAGGGLITPIAFAGGIAAVALAWVFSTGSRGRTAVTLILAGVAVAAFFTAVQTFLQERSGDQAREVLSWILGSLAAASWSDVLLLAPYVVIAGSFLLAARRPLDVMSVGDEEAASLGVRPDRTRALVVGAATLGTAAAVSVSGLIGFVGIVVPHTVRLLAGTSYRAILPLALLGGAGFLILADLIARVALSPGELPIGVVTAFVGAPFFAVVLKRSAR
ncbi:MAG: FecCD family ABC transporter permease [Acidimicrobiia bacterium]